MIRPALEGIWEGLEANASGGRQWKCDRNRVLEEELRTLQAFIPDITRDILSIFEEAVTDSLWNMLPESEARALLILVGEKGFESPCDVYSALDSILRDGSQILKNAIREEFRASIHLLMEKVEVCRRSLVGKVRLSTKSHSG
jgi:hypothetical protein